MNTLLEIEPAPWVRTVAERTVEHVERASKLIVPPSHRSQEPVLADRLLALAQYGQHGLAYPWGDELESARIVAACLCVPAVDPDNLDFDKQLDAFSTLDGLRIILHAVCGRYRLTRGETITNRQVGVLGGWDVQDIVRVHGGELRAQDALRYLLSRGVHGFGS